MRITSIELTNFRNYARASLEPCPSITVLYGDNAQGKTALLESVVLACTGRSHRTPRDRELIRWDQETGSVAVRADTKDGGHDVELCLRQDARKTVRVDGKTLARSGELMGRIAGVLFAPEDLSIVKEGPGERRRFLDMAISQMRPGYYYALQRYQRALMQRNRLLRDIPLHPGLKKTLPEWDHVLAENGISIMNYRAEFIGKLSAAAAENHREISGGHERFAVEYLMGVRDDLMNALIHSHDADIQRGSTTVGPHHDDVILTVDGRDVRAYGSQGQQRTAALSMKLAELDIMRREIGEAPILMLDDVMSELDPFRRRQLLGRLREIQTIVTCTDLTDLAEAQIGAAYRICQGVLTRGRSDGI